MPAVTISLDGHDEELAVFGSRDQYLRQVRDALGVKVSVRHGEARLEGDSDRVEQARQIIEELRSKFRRRQAISPEGVAGLIDAVRHTDSSDSPLDQIELGSGSRGVRPRTAGQTRYLK